MPASDIQPSVDDLLREARAAFSAGNFPAAGTLFQAVTRQQANHAEAIFHIGLCLNGLGRFAEAVAAFDATLAIAPDHGDAPLNKARALLHLLRYEEAVVVLDRIIASRPTPETHTLLNRAIALGELGRDAEAVADLERALAIDPDYAEAHACLGITRLRMGDFDSGWKEYQWRWQTRLAKGHARSFPRPRWTGVEDIRGKTILVHCEQGLGDTIQFSRYLPLLAARGANTIFEVPTPLAGLLSGVEGIGSVIGYGQQAPDYDFHCPTFDLPAAFAHLVPPPAAIQIAHAERTDTEFRVGLVWSGSQTHPNDGNRSIALDTLIERLPKDVRYVSLQKDLRPADAATLDRHPGIERPSLADFEQTARICASVDAVVSVDTAGAHLAGTIRKPLLLLIPFNPDWRWQRERTDTPWYPTATLYRQPAIGNWDEPLARIAMDLGAMKVAGNTRSRT